jgi:hypothetical protein
MMMGQPEAVIQQAHAEALAAPEVQDDFDIGAEDEVSLQVRAAFAGLESWKLEGESWKGCAVECMHVCGYGWQWVHSQFDIGAEDEAALQVRLLHLQELKECVQVIYL